MTALARSRDVSEATLAAIAQAAPALDASPTFPEAVVGQHDGALGQLRLDGGQHRRGAVAAPVVRVGGPAGQLQPVGLGLRRGVLGQIAPGYAPQPRPGAQPAQHPQGALEVAGDVGGGVLGMAQVRVAVRLDGVALGQRAVDQPGMALGRLAEHEEGGAGACARERVEHRGGPDRVRPIVEGEGERHRHSFRTVLPKDQRPHPACATVGSMWHRPVILSLSCSLALAACGGDGAPVPPATAASRATVVWAVGDGGTGTKAAKQVAALIARDRPDHVIYLGDVYEHGTREEFQAKFAPVYGALARRMWPTPGNHDWPSHASCRGSSGVSELAESTCQPPALRS